MQKLRNKEEFVIDPSIATFVKLDDISVQLDELIQLQISNQKVLSSLQPKEEVKQELIKPQLKSLQYNNQLSPLPTRCYKPEANSPMTETSLGDISIQFSDLINITKNNQTTLNSILSQTSISSDGINKSVQAVDQLKLATAKLINKNQISLDKISEQQTLATKELQGDADEGGRLPIKDSVSSTKFYIIDTQKMPGHMVKSIVVTNDGKHSIYVAINAAISTVGPDIIDAVQNNSEFELIKKGEHFNAGYNRKRIKNIYLLSAKDISYFRATLTW